MIDDVSTFLTCLGFSSPAWVPAVFAAYVIGRRQVSLWMLFALLTSEAIALFIAKGLFDVSQAG